MVLFVPLGNSRDGFAEQLPGISLGTDGTSLKIKFQDKTYKFDAMSAKSKKDQKSKMSALYQEISRQVNDYKAAPTTRKM